MIPVHDLRQGDARNRRMTPSCIERNLSGYLSTLPRIKRGVGSGINTYKRNTFAAGTHLGWGLINWSRRRQWRLCRWPT